MVKSSGEIAVLTDGLSVPLGVDSAVARHREAISGVEPGSYLALYSDGLVEDRALAIQDGLNPLATALTDFRGSPDELCDRIPSIVLGERADDICLLGVTIGPQVANAAADIEVSGGTGEN